MKTLFKISRSIITSLLFLLLIAILLLQFLFHVVSSNGRKISTLIDREYVLKTLIKDEELDEEQKTVALDYIDKYLNYVFYKRSYPSLETIDISNLDESKMQETKSILNTLKKKTDLNYEMICQIRDINSFITNGSISLLVSIMVVPIYLSLAIVRMSFKSATKISGIAILATGLIILISSTILFANLNNLNILFLKICLESILTKKLKNYIYKVAILYLIVGILILASFYIPSLTQKRRQNKTNYTF